MTTASLTPFAHVLGAENLTPAQERSLAEHVGPILFERFLMLAEAGLSESDRDECVSFVDEGNVDGLLEFLAERLPDFEERLAASLPRA